MADEGFLRRWSRLKTEGLSAPAGRPHAPAPSEAPPRAPGLVDAKANNSTHAPAHAAPSPDATLPTLDDVAALTADSDFGAFVAQGVDPAVRRSALRKLFTDPHFNRMDGLDVYIGDYTQPSPMPAAMLAALGHARSILGTPDAPAADASPDAPQAATEPAPQLATSPAAQSPDPPPPLPVPAAQPFAAPDAAQRPIEDALQSASSPPQPT